METKPYQSQYYPHLKQHIEITHRDYNKLRNLLIERGEYLKFKKWLTGKFIRITTEGGIIEPLVDFNPSKFMRHH